MFINQSFVPDVNLNISIFANIVTVIKMRRLKWLGRVSRMNETRSVKKIFEGKLEGGRGRGRPRLRWINDVEDDLTL